MTGANRPFDPPTEVCPTHQRRGPLTDTCRTMQPRLKILVALVAVVVAAIAAPAANAGLLVTSAERCDSQQFSHPFAQWGDNANYTPVPGGAFEPGQKGWALSGGAKIVTGNERFNVRSAHDSRSLQLPAGAVATSPSMCVGLAEPTIRWFQKSTSLLGLTGSMTVSVLTETSLGLVTETPVGAGLLSNAWSPSLTGVVITNLLPLLPDDKTAVAFRFRSLTGTWTVDDVYVDPYARR
jgi:hypothetical protein